MWVAHCNEVIEQVHGVDDAAAHAVALVLTQIEHRQRAPSPPIHSDQLRDVVVVSRRHAVARQLAAVGSAAQLALVAAHKNSRHILRPEVNDVEVGVGPETGIGVNDDNSRLQRTGSFCIINPLVCWYAGACNPLSSVAVEEADRAWAAGIRVLRVCGSD